MKIEASNLFCKHESIIHTVKRISASLKGLPSPRHPILTNTISVGGKKYPLVNYNNYMENHHVFKVHQLFSMGHIFNSKPLVVPGRVHEASHVGWSVTDCRQWIPSNHQMPGVYRVSPGVVVLQDWNSSEIRDIVRYQETIPLEMMLFHGMFHKIPLEMLMFHGISQGFFLDFAISASMESMEFPGWLLGTSLQSHACRRSVLWRMNWIKVRGWNTRDFEIFLQKIGEILWDFSPDLTQELDQTPFLSGRKTRLNQQKMKIEPAKHPEGFTRMGINGLIEVYQLRLRIQHQPTRNGLQSRYKPGNEWIDMSNIFVLNSLKWYDGPNGLPFVTWAESAPVMRWESEESRGNWEAIYLHTKMYAIYIYTYIYIHMINI